MSLIDNLKNWYTGKYIQPENDPDSPLVSLLGHYEKPFLAKFIKALIDFWLKHWKWIIGTEIAIIALLFNIF